MSKLKIIIKNNKKLYKFLVKRYEAFFNRRIVVAFLNAKANFYIRRMKRKPKKDKIRVGFLVQMPELWDKQVLVYEEMKARDGIETYIFVVPPYDFANNKCRTDYGDNYFLKNYLDAIKTVQSDGTVIDIKDFALDYMFLQRPYDIYLPEDLRSSKLMKFVKLCYVPYGYSLSTAFLGLNTNQGFFRNISFCFADIREVFDLLKQKIGERVNLVGYPEFELYFDSACQNEKKSVLWTPRWSCDSKVGGSHFLEYKDEFIELAKKYTDVKFSIRPHPLMFDNFTKKGIMTEKEIADYKVSLKNNNIELSEGKKLSDDLLNADVLISDYSSILAMFFVTGKPIVFCDNGYEFTDEMAVALQGMYTPDNWREVECTIDELLFGKDILREKRNDIIKKYFSYHKEASKRITDIIEKDGLK